MSDPYFGPILREVVRGTCRESKDPGKRMNPVRGAVTVRLMASLGVLVIAALLLVGLGWLGQRGRVAPRPEGEGTQASVYWASTQEECYGILKGLGVRGVEAVQIGRYFNMAEYFPEEQNQSRPFPVRPYDIRPDYEAGINSGNWLFVATRTGLVRRVTNVLPDLLFRDRLNVLLEDHYALQPDGALTGYTYDIPQRITTLASLRPVDGPVVIIVDAGFFIEPAEPKTVAATLRNRLPDVAALILVKSLNEPDITLEARERLTRFLLDWGI